MKPTIILMLICALCFSACQQAPAPSGDLPTLASLDNQNVATPTMEGVLSGGATAAPAVSGPTLTVGSFSAIVQSLPANVSVSAGAEASVRIEADPTILALIQSTVSDDTLDLRISDGTTVDASAITVRITVPTLRAYTLSGAGVVNISSLVTETLQIDLTGSGDIILQPLTAQSVTVNITGQGRVDFAAVTAVEMFATIGGSGTVDVLGNVESLTLTAPGSGEFRAADLMAGSAQLDIGGSLAAFVNVMQQLDVTMSGSGSVQFSGTPQVNANVTGGGRVVDSAGNVVAGQ